MLRKMRLLNISSLKGYHDLSKDPHYKKILSQIAEDELKRLDLGVTLSPQVQVVLVLIVD